MQRIGKAKKGKLNHLIKILDKKKVKYNIKELSQLSIKQMAKKIEQIEPTKPGIKNSWENRGKIIDETGF